jgi:hypothetical protein
LATASPLLAWLAARSALDAEAEAAIHAADADAAAPGAADPERVSRALLAAGRPAEALRLAACALPPREGVWWAWVAARHALAMRQATPASDPAAPGGAAASRPPSAAEQAALDAVERWIVAPTDEHRRAAWGAGQDAGLETAVGGVAAAAFFATGSLAPPESPMAVPPPPGAHVTFAAGAALLASAETDPTRMAEVAGAFVTQAVEVVRRLGGWEQAAIVARQHFEAQRDAHAQATGGQAAPGAQAGPGGQAAPGAQAGGR